VVLPRSLPRFCCKCIPSKFFISRSSPLFTHPSPRLSLPSHLPLLTPPSLRVSAPYDHHERHPEALQRQHTLARPCVRCRHNFQWCLICHPRTKRNSKDTLCHPVRVIVTPRGFCARISLPLSSFPGQEHVAGSYKIPTILYYDKNGNVKVAGAEAEGSAIIDLAEDEGWTKAELYVLYCSCRLNDTQYYQHRFKLRLRPQSMKLQMNGMRLPPLPKGKTAVQVFGEYLGYLFRCTKNFVVDTHANGASLWRAIEEDLQLVLSHPNGWEGAQQTKMRRAAVYGGLIPDTDAGKARIRFVTEGEASLHACVLNGLAKEMLTVQAFPYPLSPTLIPVVPGPPRTWVSCRGCRRWHPRHQFVRRARNCPTCHGRDRAARLSVINIFCATFYSPLLMFQAFLLGRSSSAEGLVHS
jgi:hypothetical protein